MTAIELRKDDERDFIGKPFDAMEKFIIKPVENTQEEARHKILLLIISTNE